MRPPIPGATGRERWRGTAITWAGDRPDHLFPTRGHDAQAKREIRQAHSREVEETAYLVVHDAGAIDLDALVTSAARHLGFTRVGGDVRSSVTAAVRNLQRLGWVSADDDSRIRVLERAED